MPLGGRRRPSRDTDNVPVARVEQLASTLVVMTPASTRPRSTDRLREAMGWRRVRRPQRPVLFINPRSGGGTAVRLSLARRARDLGIEPVVLEPGQDLAALVAAPSRGADALGMAGGDGSMAVVAGAAAAHGLPFACVPAGTRNHFARDLGVLRHDVVGALEAFSAGLERSIDLGEVNGAPFVDNVVLGFYGDAIRREGYRDARLRTLVATARDALGPRAPAPGVAVVDDRGDEHRDPALVLVSTTLRGRARRRAVDASATGQRPARHRGPRSAGAAAHRPCMDRDRDRGRGGGRPARRARRGGRDPRPAAALRDPAPRAAGADRGAAPGASPSARMASLDPRRRISRRRRRRRSTEPAAP